MMPGHWIGICAQCNRKVYVAHGNQAWFQCQDHCKEVDPKG